jgi:O-acetyl-ADP-ribose deacetylase (regulator of RNase III)
MKLKVIIKKGDLTTSETDAIVNAANTNLWMGAGVAGAIKRAGGKVIEDEAIAKGPIEIGSAIESTAGNLKVKFVIHAAVMGQNLITSEEFIRDATSNTLQLCEKLKIKSVSFPAFGTGVGGFSGEKCAQIMLSVILNFKPSYLEEVHFYLFDEEMKNIFESTYQNFMPS